MIELWSLVTGSRKRATLNKATNALSRALKEAVHNSATARTVPLKERKEKKRG